VSVDDTTIYPTGRRNPDREARLIAKADRLRCGLVLLVEDAEGLEVSWISVAYLMGHRERSIQ
jgi:hypothetical protein